MKDFIKDFIFSMVLIVFVVGAGCIGGYIDNHDYNYGTVVDYENGYYIIEDPDGELWGYKSDELYIGAEVKMIMFNNLTPHYIYDDEISKIFVK